MVMMLRWFLQGDDDTSADPQSPISTSAEEVARDYPSEVRKEDGVENK